ncbi:hypothetical protein, partial [Lewinella sp. W8]|uniref:Ig-like domain-containing protein n=1 Tax=Lewinella sp. W8 TaxID=2528208 RepID=UPI0012B50D17
MKKYSTPRGCSQSLSNQTDHFSRVARPPCRESSRWGFAPFGALVTLLLILLVSSPLVSNNVHPTEDCPEATSTAFSGETSLIPPDDCPEETASAQDHNHAHNLLDGLMLELETPAHAPTFRRRMMETLPAGTLIIAMDDALQDGSSARVRQAYGLAVHLLHAEIPLKWIINSGKTSRTGVDFSASARRRYPTTSGYTTRNFRAGPIAIFPGFEADAQAVINSFGNDIRVYELQSATTVEVNSDLLHKPFVFVEEDQNPDIHTGILSAAGLTEDANGATGGITGHYQEGSLTTVNANSCVTIITVPHNDAISTAQVNAVKAFTRDGGNFFAQCAGVRGFQGQENASVRVFTNAGFVDEPGLGTFLYDNPQEPSAQFEGDIEDEGGSLENFAFQTDPPGGTRIVHDSDNDFKAYAGRIDGFNSASGGYVHYLGGHDHGGDIDADRFYLNAVLRSATRPMGCGLSIATVTAADDSGTIDCGTSSIDIDVLSNDVDLTNNPPLTIQNLTNTTPSLGTFAVVSGQVRFTPNFSGTWAGPAVATYQACNSNNLCAQATITVESSTPGQQIINGTVFEDLNGNGTFNTGPESGQSGIDVFLFEDSAPMDGTPDGPAVQTATTDGSGNYNFSLNLQFEESFMYNQRINNNNDDSFEETSGKGAGDVFRNDAEVKIGGGDDRVGGFRFRNTNIPANATINSAFMYWDNSEGGKGDQATVRIRAQDNALNPAAFGTSTNDISNRNTTTEFVNYDIDWNGGETNQQTPDLSSVIQEVVDENNGADALVFIVDHVSGDEIKVVSHDASTSGAARLEISGTEPGGGPFNYLVQVDQSDLPVGTSLTTPGSQPITFTTPSVLECDVDFGYEQDCPDPPDAGSDGSTSICEGTGSLNLRDIINGEDAGGSWVQNTGPTGLTISGNNVSFAMAAPGTYTFTYTVSAPDCPDDESTATVTVTEQLSAGTPEPTLTVCVGSLAIINLSTLLTGEDAGGTWTAGGGNPLGGIFTALTGTFNLLGAGVGTYTFTYSIAASGGCAADEATVTIEVSTQLTAGTALGDLEICETDNAVIDLFARLTGEDAGGSWTAGVGNPSGGTFVAAAGTFDPTGASLGVYTFTYGIPASGGCAADDETVTIIIS